MIDNETYQILDNILKYLKTNNKSGIKSFSKTNSNYERFIAIYRKYDLQFQKVIKLDLMSLIKDFWGEKDIKLEDVLGLGIERGTVPNDILALKFRVELHVFYRLYKMNHYEENTIKNISDLINENDNAHCWYRGQINSEWELIPSFFRNIKKTQLWNWNMIKKEYESKPRRAPLTRKLEKLGIDVSSSYMLSSFIQHSIGFSPLIDFSKSPKPALSFALANGANLPAYYGENACIFELKIGGADIISDLSVINKLIEGVQIQVFDKSPHITNLIQNEMWQKILMGSKSVVHFFDYPTSDRMRFQRGTFAMFDNVIIIGNEIYFSFDKAKYLNGRLVKYIIKKNKKDSLYKQLMKEFPYYHPRFLLNPYLYIGETDK